MHDGKMENAVFLLKCGGDPILWRMRSRKSKQAHAENENEGPGTIGAKDCLGSGCF